MILKWNWHLTCLAIITISLEANFTLSLPQNPLSETFEEGCECVPFYLCANNTINTDGSGLIDRRLGQCTDSVEVCCGQKLSPQEVPNKPGSVEPVSLCGQRNAEGVGFRVIGGDEKESQFGEFPWMVAILEEVELSNEKSKLFICGGSLIHEKVVLTAAHCVENKLANKLTVRAGEWDTQTTQEPLPHQDRGVSEVIFHENFDKKKLLYDVALLVSSEPFVKANNVRTICLPKSVGQPQNQQCWVSGWGKSRFGKQGKYQVILRKVPLPVVPLDVCQNEMRKTRLGPKFQLHSSFVCAGGVKDLDACEGDGGGPLVCPIDGSPDRYHQIGIVAWGIGCGTETPGAYANVEKVKSWIDQQMERLNLVAAYNY